MFATTHRVTSETDPVLPDVLAFVTSLIRIDAMLWQWLNLHQVGTPGERHDCEHFTLILLDNKWFK